MGILILKVQYYTITHLISHASTRSLMSHKTFVIGDVHGCYYTLLNLLQKLPVNSRKIFVGDLCDRGLHSCQVFELCINNNFEVVKGNHEDYMYTYAHDAIEGKPNRWIDLNYMGGQKTLQSYKGNMERFLKHREWIATLPKYIMSKNVFITHGFGLPYFKRRDKEESRIGLLKNRITDEPEWGHEWEKGWENYEIFNVFGHTMYDEPLFGPNYCGIDLGCGAGKRLAALELESKTWIYENVNSKDRSN